MFIGRERELTHINKLYSSNKFEFAVIYGRRRIGKTTLINEFIKDKQAICYTGVEGNEKENLEGLSKSIYSISNKFSESTSSFASYRDALETVFRIAEKSRIVLVVDEYPYIAESYAALSSILQVLIDKNKDTSKLFLILCGSSLSFMENQVLGYKSPLFGRRTAQYKLNPFNFFEVIEFYKNFNNVDLATVFGVTGGVPMYMAMFDDKLSVADNIKNNFLEPNSYLFEEPANLIKQECRDPAQYNSIIKAIATGSSRFSEICSKTGIGGDLCSSYLKKLINIGIVKKEMPFGTKSTRKTIYKIEDSMFRFWYRFIPENLAMINMGQSDVVYKKIEEQISSFMGPVFEEICKQYLWQLNIRDKAAISFTNLGRWWGNDPIRKTETEVDIVAEGDEGNILLCECKWTNEKVNIGNLETLVERSRLFSYKQAHLYMFAKTGYNRSCIEKAQMLGNVTLVTYDEMMRTI